jgi:hypothetical protein
MSMTLTRCLASVVIALGVSHLALAEGAKPNNDGPTVMAKRGKELLNDNFDGRSDLGKVWKNGIALVTVQDGVMVGKELPEKNHAAVVKTQMTFKDIVADFDFRFDGGKGVNFVMDDNTYKGSHAGHIARVSFNGFGINLGDSKTGTMANENYENKDKPEFKEKLAEVRKKTEAQAKVKLEQGKWYHATVEVLGDEMVVSLDGKPVGYLKSPGIAHEAKNLLGFSLSGQVDLIDNVRVCEATASDDWSKRRSEMEAMMKANAQQPAKNAPKGKGKK